MPGIDYSKWDNLSSGSDDSSADDNHNQDQTDLSPLARYLSGPSSSPSFDDMSKAEIQLFQRRVDYTKEDSEEGWLLVGPNKNIRIHPEDSRASTYPNIIFTEDPNTFVPDRTKYEEQCVLNWGIDPPSEEEEDMNEIDMMQKMMMKYNSSSFMYEYSLGDPEVQFINILIRRRAKYNNSEAVTAAMKFSYIVKIELRLCEEDVWRRVRVPSGIALSVFHDQVLCPVMGWSRGYHGYAFEDPKDGTVVGPANNGGYIDSMHIPQLYKKVMDDKGCPLAALLIKKGDYAHYNYDLGDNWEHRLTLEEIVKEENSVTLMGGRGACPPEDSLGLDRQGCKGYEEFLNDYKSNPNEEEVQEVMKKARSALNYSRPWTGGPPIPFKPLEFNIEYHRMVMNAMIAGPLVTMRKDCYGIPGEEKYDESYEGCEKCGSRLKILSKCSGCRTVSYCSRECQRRDWKKHKVQCKQVSNKKTSK